MRYKYDAKTDILMIELGKGRPDFGEQNQNIITHYTKKGLPVEIEILDASRTVGKLMQAIKKKGISIAVS
jgi:uncharacterized protein YuzE